MNGMEQKSKGRTMGPENILEMFLEVVQQHASKSYDFPLSNVSGKFVLLNFYVRAFLIYRTLKQKCEKSEAHLCSNCGRF